MFLNKPEAVIVDVVWKDDDGNVVTINQYYLIAEDNIDQELFNRVSNREEISEGMLEDIDRHCNWS